ncbi:TPA: short-chain dehydrogenase, partial [Klebsiella pneumoniae]|nr:short-chain dehydrogenase [Klebsiella pneumoniae]
GPEAVVEKVRHAFTSDKPKLRYPVTLVTHAVALLKRLLPARAMDKIIHG